MPQPQVVVFSADDVENVPMLSDNQTFTGTNTFTQQIVSTLATGTSPLAVTSTTKVSNMNVDQVDGADLDTDGTFTANSDTKIPSQKAVKTYSDTKLALSGGTVTGNVSMGANTLTVHAVKADASDGVLIEAGNGTDVAILGAGNSANALFYGGVNITGDLTVTGDDIFMTTNTANYVLMADGTNYNPTSPSDARTGLGLVIGTNVQAYDADTLTASNTKTLTNKTIQDLKVTVVSKSADYTVSSSDSIIVVTASCTITLPTASSNTNRVVVIKDNISTPGSVTIAAADSIDGAASKSLATQYSTATVFCDGSTWHIISYYAGGAL